MAGQIKVKNKHDQLIKLDADILEDFKKAIAPLSISEFFRQQQYDIVEEFKKKEPSSTLTHFLDPRDKQQTTLDVYKMERLEISNHISNIQDKKLLGEIQAKGKIIMDVARTRLRKIAYKQ